jgi:hypothetical protein
VSDWTRQEGISRTEASTCPEGMVLTSSVRSMGDRLGCKDFSIVTDSPEERICQRSRCVWRSDRLDLGKADEVRWVLWEVMTEADWETIALAASQSVHRHLMERVQGVMGFRAIFETAKPNTAMDALGWGRRFD